MLFRDKWQQNILSRTGGELREEQIKSAEKLFDSILRGNNYMLEAPTGSGKTLMMLGAAFLAGKKVLLSTSNKMLQDQAVATWQKLTNHIPVVLMGRSNYICSHMVQFYLRKQEKNAEFYAEIQKLSLYLKQVDPKSQKPDLHRLSFLAQELQWSAEFKNYATDNLTTNSSPCHGEHGHNLGDGKVTECIYSVLLRQAAKAPLVIMNHHLLLLLALKNEFACKNILSQHFLFVDEAHDLATAATSIFTNSISTERLGYFIGEISRLRHEKDSYELKFSQALMEALNQRLQEEPFEEEYQLYYTQDNFWVIIQDFIQLGLAKLTQFSRNINSIWSLQCATLFDNICNFLMAVNDAPPTNDSPTSTPAATNSYRGGNALDKDEKYLILSKAVTEYRRHSSSKDFRIIRYLWTNPQKTQERKLSEALLNVHILLKILWPKLFQGVAFLSATLTIPGVPKAEAFDWFIQRTGIPSNTPRLIMPPVFDYRSNCRVYLPTPESNFSLPSSDYSPAHIELGGRLIHLLRGRTLMLFTATQRLQQSGEILQRVFEKFPDIELFVQGTGTETGRSTPDWGQHFEQKINSALLGTRTFFQGFDAPGETLSCLVLEKLPFPPANDPILCARCEDEKGDSFQQVILPEMLMQLRQALGRLLRTPQDRGIFVLLDPRAQQSTYASAVQAVWEPAVKAQSFTDSEELTGLIAAEKDFFPFKLNSDDNFSKRFEEVWAQFQKNRFKELLKQFGIEKLYDWQEKVMQRIADREPAILVIQPAGGGKSITYQIPALLQSSGLVLVVSPLISLMDDQVLALQEKGFERQCAKLSGTMSQAERDEIMERAQRGELRLLYVTPERLAGQYFTDKITKVPGGISLMVIDEAHMISESGSTFRPLYRALSEARKLLGNPPVMLVTATAGKKVRQDLDTMFGIAPEEVIQKSMVRPRVRISVVKVNSYTQLAATKEFLEDSGGLPVLIYVSFVKYAKDLAERLRQYGIPPDQIATYHGKMSEEERAKNHRRFLHGQARVMIATSAYGMGIDKPDIWGVIFHNMPNSIEEMVQGFGRVCRKKFFMDKYSNEWEPPRVQVNYKYEDYIDQKESFIIKPYQEISSKVVLYFLSLDSKITVTLDQDNNPEFNSFWSILSFLKKIHRLKNFHFDWAQSAFIVENLQKLNNGSEDYKSYLEAQKAQKLADFEEVRNFCLTQECRNLFLQKYFVENEASRCCNICDNDGEVDYIKHWDYLEEVKQKMTMVAPTRLPDGMFLGTDHDFNAEIAYWKSRGENGILKLRRIHRHTGKSYTDANFIANYLEYDHAYKSVLGSLNLAQELERLEKFAALNIMAVGETDALQHRNREITATWLQENITYLMADEKLDDPINIFDDLDNYLAAFRTARFQPEQLSDDGFAALDEYASCANWQGQLNSLRQKFARKIERKNKVQAASSTSHTTLPHATTASPRIQTTATPAAIKTTPLSPPPPRKKNRKLSPSIVQEKKLDSRDFGNIGSMFEELDL